MSIPRPPQPVKLVISLFLHHKDLFESAAGMLTDRFGPPDLVSSWFGFDFTDYYQPEMGAPLYRRMMAFKILIAPGDLARIKLATNQVEQRYLKNKDRAINIDPGYLAAERFVLASGKNFTHRIYIGRGIYADLTLIYTRGSFQALSWTYPDYRGKDMLTFLERVRRKYLLDVKARQSENSRLQCDPGRSSTGGDL